MHGTEHGTRFAAAVAVLVLVVAACSSPKDDLRAELREDGLDDDAIDCIFDAFDDAGIDLDDLGDAAELTPEQGLAMTPCLDAVFGAMFEDAFSEFGEQLEEGFSEGFSDLDTDGEGFGFASPEDLASMADACRAGDNAACDDLWLQSPINSPEEQLAESCGGRSAEPQLGTCAFSLGG